MVHFLLQSDKIAAVIVCHAPRLFRLLTLGSRDYTAMAVWPFVISTRPAAELDAVLLRHERIHFRQQLEMLVIPFFIWYTIEFLIRFVRHRDRYTAYTKISFEREAYQFEADPEYLQRRKFWSFLRFLSGNTNQNESRV